MADSLKEMVEQDLKGRGIGDPRVLAAFRKVDRARFVTALEASHAYEDRALSLTHGQTISQPYMVAIMLQELQFTGKEKVLEIGTGSGYQTALLQELGGEVWTVERLEPLATGAEDRLEALGYTGIRFRLGDGTEGWPEWAPYDRIVVSAACPEIPAPLCEQLAEGGRLAAPVGPPQGQELVIGVKRKGRLERRYSTSCVFVRLIGKHGFSEDGWQQRGWAEEG